MRTMGGDYQWCDWSRDCNIWSVVCVCYL